MQETGQGLFNVGAGTTVSFTGLTMSSDTICIYSLGTITVSNCVFTSPSFAGGYGIDSSYVATVTGCTFIDIAQGAISNGATGTLTVGDSSFIRCNGGIYNGGTATMIGCAMDDTQASYPEYSLLNGGTLTVTNCSIADKGWNLGLFYNAGTLVFQNCTLVENGSVPSSVIGGTVTLKNTLYRRDPAAGATTDGGGNLLLDRTGTDAPTLAADLAALGLDPTGLQDNGGPTLTIKLFGGPAINGGLPANIPVGLTTDQRGGGFPRSVGTVDIGAYEHPDPVDLVSTTASAAEGTGAGTTTFTFTVSRPGATTAAVTLDYAVTGTGTNPADAADFGGTLPSGSITLGVGVASNTIIIQVSKDALVEPDETFTLTLSNPTAAHAVAGSGAVATILNDDVAPNSAPTDITLSNAALAENNAANATVGTLSATDSDAGETHTFTLVAGTGSTDNAAFSITGSALKINAAADFEAKSSYAIRVRVTDSGAGNLTFEKPFIITVTDVNEPPIGGLDGIARLDNTTQAKIKMAVLLGNDTDPEGDPRTITAVSNAQPPGSAVGILGGFVIYYSPSNNAGDGSFDYTLSDGHGHTVTVTVTQVVVPPPAQAPNAASITMVGSDVVLSYVGVPGNQYRIQYTTSTGPAYVWQEFNPLAVYTAPANGVFTHTDVNPSGPVRLYRAIPHP